MSKKGGSISGRRGGASSRLSGFNNNAASVGVPEGASNTNCRNSHFKGVQNGAKYEMLMWQSKLQEKFLKEEKVKKETLSTPRRKSDEDYLKPPSSSRTKPLRGGSGGGGPLLHTITTPIISDPKVNFYQTSHPPSQEAGEERLINITREESGGDNHFNNPTPTQQNTNLSNNMASKYLGTINHQLENHNEGLPKIGKFLPSTPALPKLNNSVSCDNLVKPAGTSYYQNHSTNLAFFGLSGFGQGTGAGAPRRSPSGRLMTTIQGHPEIRYHQKDTRGFDQTLRYMMDKEKIHQYKEDLDKQVLEQGKAVGRNYNGYKGRIKIMGKDQEEPVPDMFMRSSRNSNSGMELAPLIRKYKSLPRLNTLNSTDVTKQFVTSPRRGDYCLSPFSPEPKEIAKSLSIQLEEKARKQQIQVEDERIAAEKHFNTWDSFWGRPGGGAPIFYGRDSRIGASTPSLVTSRSDLFKALHMTHQNKPKEK